MNIAKLKELLDYDIAHRGGVERDKAILCTHRAWLARRTAELAGKEPDAVSGDVRFDGRAQS